MKIWKIVLIALGIVLLAALPMQSASAYGGPWGPCARLADPFYSHPAINPLGPNPGQVRSCYRRMWKYGPPPWTVVRTPPVRPVIVLQTTSEQ